MSKTQAILNAIDNKLVDMTSEVLRLEELINNTSDVAQLQQLETRLDVFIIQRDSLAFTWARVYVQHLRETTAV